MLRETETLWNSPLQQYGLQSSPGLQFDPSVSPPTDAVVRFTVNYTIQDTRKGARFTSGEELEIYLSNPKGTYGGAPSNAFRFPVASSSAPPFSKPTGRLENNNGPQSQLGMLTFNYGKRKGVTIDLDQRRKEGRVNSSSADSKFSPKSHPFFLLSPDALPPGTPAIVLEQARAAFSCSVTMNTQQNYATSVRHLKDAEVAMGRKFSLPMTSQERAFFVSHMIGKGLKKSTINGYLSALRHYELASGAPHPAENSELTKHLLVGHDNSQRDPRVAVMEKQRRPFTAQMLKLLGHSIAASNKPEYEQSMLWTVALVAFWGTMRLSELLCENRFDFNEKCSLMISDLFLNKESIGIWLRSEKIASVYGNVIVIWNLPSRPD